MHEKTSSYLKGGRLGEVLALIQVLSYDRDTSRSEAGLVKEFQGTPDSANNWLELARFHPELFRVRSPKNNKVERVALVARYVLPYELLDDGSEKRPQLESTVVNKLMELAIELHDRQLERRDKWKTLVPMLVVIISAVASIVAALISVSGTGG